MGPPVNEDENDHGGGGSHGRCCFPPPPASWPAAGSTTKSNRNSESNSESNSSSINTNSNNSSSGVLGLEGSSAQAAGGAVPPSSWWSGFDEEFEVNSPGRGDTTFFVRVAGRELAATNGVAVVLHGGGFTGMSWAPAASVMKHDVCILAPDLRGHGLTSSFVDSNTREGGHGDGDAGDAGDAENSDSDGGGGGEGGENALMSLESLAEDVTSLLVEIFASGLLFQPRLPRRQRKQKLGQEVLEQDRSSGSSSGDGSDPMMSCSATVGAGLPLHDSAGTSGHGEDSSSSSSSISCSVDASGGTEAQSNKNPARVREKVAAFGIGGSGGSCASSPVKLLLVGHSLGGSIAVRVTAAAEEVKRRSNGAAEVAGVVAVDVVEGTALAALDDMPEILRRIPRSFRSMEEAVLWHVKTGAVRNAVSAQVVVPSRLKKDPGSERVVWRTDLRSTKRHWRGWFEGMSKAFLHLPVPKLLVVAGMDRLDTELTAAHMQGRRVFQLKLVYGCGHSVQEDQPNETAGSIISFAVRNSILRRGTSGATSGGRRAGEEEEEVLRRKLARARDQANQNRR
ncbi:unnamed protein product [Pylaiella littoralis]